MDESSEELYRSSDEGEELYPDEGVRFGNGEDAREKKKRRKVWLQREN